MSVAYQFHSLNNGYDFESIGFYRIKWKIWNNSYLQFKVICFEEMNDLQVTTKAVWSIDLFLSS